MKKTNYLFAGIIVFLLVLGTAYFALDISTPIGTSQTVLDDGMGGGDTRLPTFRPDKEISEITLPPLDYIVYSVKKGDMVGEIASRYGVSQDAIISLNKLRNTRTLQIGQLLKIPSMDGIVYTPKKGDTPEKLADTYKISLEKLALVNNISDNNVLKAGAAIFLPDAKLDWVTLQEINGDLFKSPIRGGYRVTSRYGWRGAFITE